MSKEIREQINRVRNWKQFLNESTENEFPNSITIKFTRDGYEQLFKYLQLYPYNTGGYNKRWKYMYDDETIIRNLQSEDGFELKNGRLYEFIQDIEQDRVIFIEYDARRKEIYFHRSEPGYRPTNSSIPNLHSSGAGSTYVQFDKLEVGALSNRGKVGIDGPRVHIFEIVETS
jgi:hypothetical protein